MTAVLYRCVAALLDLAHEHPQDRPRAWRALDRLRLSPEEESTLRLCLDDDDDRRANEFAAWSSSLLLSKSIAGSTQSPTKEERGPRFPSPPVSRGALRLVVGGCVESTDGSETGGTAS